MENSDGFTDSVPSSSNRPGKCERCGATIRLDTGVCASCLLREGLAAGEEVSRAAFESVIAEVDVPDRQWRLGNYEILDEIGRGGMGVIYRARQRHSHRIVAVKRALNYQADSRDKIMRFRREADAAASLDHPNILPIYEVSESEDGLPFFSMKFAAGGSLREAGPSLRNQPRKCVQVMAKVARATEYAHGRGILHRDLKPGNILLDDRGEALVSDFGLAKAVEGNSDLTKSLTTFGTPGYLAPEQAEGVSAKLTPAADVYSLGAILFDLLTGRPPFVGENALAVIRQAAEMPAPKLRSLAHSHDRDLETICARCLERDPKARYQSAGALATDLERWLDGRPIVARPVSPPARIWRWSRRNPKLVATGAAGLFIGAAAIWFFRGELFRASQFNPPGKSIAVLPFVDLSQAKDQEYFCDGVSEEILHSLAKVDGLRVTGRTSSFSFKGSGAGASEIGKRLNVQNVLEGSLQRDGDSVRITAELIDARTGFQLWSQTYERELQGVFALQDEITRSIVNALKIKLAVSLPVHEQRNTEVYDLYLQGLFFSNKSSEEDLRRALDFFQRALEKDPTFSHAWTGIAKVWYFLADVYVRPLEAYPASKEAAFKALALDEKDAEAHCYLGEAKRVLDWDVAGEDAELQRALELDPNSAPAHFFSALLPLFRGQPKEGLQLVLEAEKFDPVSPITSYVATAAYLADDRIDEAISEGQRTLQLDPNYFYLDSNLAAAYREKGNFADAIALYTKAQEATHLPSSGLAITYSRMGRQKEAQSILARLLQARERRYVSAPVIAAVYTAFNDKEEAFRWLERAFAEHSGILQWIAFLPEFRSLHSDARFPHLLQRIGVSRNAILTITETTLSQTADPNVRNHLTLKIGVKPRPGTPNGHAVRIIVSFYDLTRDNKITPTDARVGYDWLTSANDWSDGTAKFLAATYVRPKTQTASSDGRRYGGFIVRVYFDGELQDSRATPQELITLFPNEDKPATSPNAAPTSRP
jgi:TolB-like protein/tetratricopeptide (TPR) repeat protein/tRNA A-37 threonylcarbamoyl transferase component Bud32